MLIETNIYTIYYFNTLNISFGNIVIESRFVPIMTLLTDSIDTTAFPFVYKYENCKEIIFIHEE